ncbi:predicted GPI-anchored protein 58 [Xiphophorus hellerii]|uniref:predicted GPI-anchored protein 58 n=1 Tax=Xiphophorus hellerii TaxID=8084 RepID=UPI0013B4610C|nr:predicted GPI-anchored protein 58 [Xiphophorus hellerii]
MSISDSNDPFASSYSFPADPIHPSPGPSRRSARLATRLPLPTPSAALAFHGISPGSDLDPSQLASLAALLPHADSPPSSPALLPPPHPPRKRSRKSSPPPAKRRRGRPAARATDPASPGPSTSRSSVPAPPPRASTPAPALAAPAVPTPHPADPTQPSTDSDRLTSALISSINLLQHTVSSLADRLQDRSPNASAQPSAPSSALPHAQPAPVEFTLANALSGRDSGKTYPSAHCFSLSNLLNSSSRLLVPVRPLLCSILRSHLS